MGYGIRDFRGINCFYGRIFLLIRKCFEYKIDDRFKNKIKQVNQSAQENKLHQNHYQPVIRNIVPNEIMNEIADLLQEIFGLLNFLFHSRKNKKIAC